MHEKTVTVWVKFFIPLSLIFELSSEEIITSFQTQQKQEEIVSRKTKYPD